MADDFYRKVTADINYYGSSTFGTEPDVREELINTLEGKFPEIAKGQPGLLRKMRRDEDEKLIPCECVDTITHEPDKDRFCSLCHSSGWYWDEVDIVFYRVLQDSDVDNILRDSLKEPGLLNVPLVVFYIRYDAAITKDDKLVRLELTDSGEAESPVKRKGIYRINHLWDYRADNGKLEYWKVFAHEEKTKYLNTPSFSDLE